MEEDYNRPDEPKVYNHYTYGSEDDYLKLREDSFRDKNLITTPGWIVKDMLDLLPDSVWNTETTFLIPCIKSGNFAIEVKNRLMKCQDALEKFPDEFDRRNHIDSKQLFCIYWYTEEEFNKNLISGHIWGVNGFLEALCSPSVNFMCTDDLNFDTFKDKTGKKQEKLLESIKEKFGTVKFDVVIGNPPYNNDLYIDFVQWGHQRANKYSLWITPAKWQAKGGDKNERFRQTIVPYMKDIVYYPDTTEVFDINMAGGVSYFSVDRTEYTTTHIINKSVKSKAYNNEQYRKVSNCLNNILMDFLRNTTIKTWNPLTLDVDYFHAKIDSKDSGEITVVSADSSGEFYCLGHCNKNSLTNCGDACKYKVIMCRKQGGATISSDKNGMYLGTNKISILEPNIVPKNEYMILGVFNTLTEAESLKSYLSTRLVQFIINASLIGANLTNKESWRFVPDPGAFDHIFTDEEIYAKYSLTQDEINLIQSVIKERK